MLGSCEDLSWESTLKVTMGRGKHAHLAADSTPMHWLTLLGLADTMGCWGIGHPLFALGEICKAPHDGVFSKSKDKGVNEKPNMMISRSCARAREVSKEWTYRR